MPKSEWTRLSEILGLKLRIRQWFERKRAQLDGGTPLDQLKARWKPMDPGPRRVQDLARALVASPAT